MWDTANSVAGWRRSPRCSTSTTSSRRCARGSARHPGARRRSRPGRRLRLRPGDAGARATSSSRSPPAGPSRSSVRPVQRQVDARAAARAAVGPDTGPSRSTTATCGAGTRRAVPTEVAYVAQDTFLFDDDVRGNVTLGRDVTDDQVRGALRLANAAVFVEALPDGLDTGSASGARPSPGGQQQRLALARALVRSPRLLVLDDATSAVDPSVEAASSGACATPSCRRRSSWSPTGARASCWPTRWCTSRTDASSATAPTRSCCVRPGYARCSRPTTGRRRARFRGAGRPRDQARSREARP
jgi:hypothetical protein